MQQSQHSPEFLTMPPPPPPPQVMQAASPMFIPGASQQVPQVVAHQVMPSQQPLQSQQPMQSHLVMLSQQPMASQQLVQQQVMPSQQPAAPYTTQHMRKRPGSPTLPQQMGPPRKTVSKRQILYNYPFVLLILDSCCRNTMVVENDVLHIPMCNSCCKRNLNMRFDKPLDS